MKVPVNSVEAEKHSQAVLVGFSTEVLSSAVQRLGSGDGSQEYTVMMGVNHIVGGTIEFIIRDLPSNMDVIDLKVTAMNRDGLISQVCS